MRITNFLLAVSAIAGLAAAQDSMTDAGAGWAPEFKMAGRQIIALAEAIPAEKYGWRPGPGVRSVGEVLGHDATCEGVLLRALAHANEHLGQMIAYARVNGVAPPWSN